MGCLRAAEVVIMVKELGIETFEAYALEQVDVMFVWYLITA